MTDLFYVFFFFNFGTHFRSRFHHIADMRIDELRQRGGVPPIYRPQGYKSVRNSAS